MYSAPVPTPADSVQVLALGDSVLLVEATLPGVRGLRCEIPLDDYRDDMAVNFRAWVAFMRQPGTLSDKVLVLHR